MRIRSYFKELDMNKTLFMAGAAAGAFLVAFLFWWQWGSNIIGIKNEDQSRRGTRAEPGLRRPRASLTGLTCGNYSKRPIAVMMASDPIARPLSGIGQADVVIEMPVTPNGITRMMAVFQCEESAEIGSVRSAREDFLPLVASFGALYAHWGGEREALNKLNNEILDNIDAMKYEGTVFYRKNSVPRPHNGFTTIELLEDKAEDLGYDSSDTFLGYLRREERPERNLSNIVESISIDYESPYDVKWVYDSNSNVYKRTRGGEAEIDANTGRQAESSVVALMRTRSAVLSIDYISVSTAGEGEAEFYQNGIKTGGTWKNSNNDLRFYDTNGQEMKFVPGKMWIEIVTK
ncbi:MAG TPA: DUF3048 domain-containing protein [Candidatus Paceibacterota bacterium]|nr:DUF3048 domain-containing protein [Candidatus Paceibacterota bacterium]